MDVLLDALAALRAGTTFNQYRDDGPLDRPGAAATRRANLRRYLEERPEAVLVLVGEAAGHGGARFSGIPFTSERHLAAWGQPYAPTSAPGDVAEPSATVVQRTLAALGAERRVLLWNAVPTHPHRPGSPHTNRRPTAGEVRAAGGVLRELLALAPAARVVAVGRVAEAALGGRAPYVRHPSMGGAAAFRDGVAALLERR